MHGVVRGNWVLLHLGFVSIVFLGGLSPWKPRKALGSVRVSSPAPIGNCHTRCLLMKFISYDLLHWKSAEKSWLENWVGPFPHEPMNRPGFPETLSYDFVCFMLGRKVMNGVITQFKSTNSFLICSNSPGTFNLFLDPPLKIGSSANP